MNDAHAAGVHQKLTFNINRSDYMLSGDGHGQYKLLQVEHNTIAAAGFTHSQNVARMHRYAYYFI